jgi:S-adenosylmethionine hydrolase
MTSELSTITLLTDFGGRMGYVGQMKGVILSINPAVRVIDLSHDVAPQAILQAQVILEQSLPYFPPGAIHVAVVDPGVGTDRQAVVIDAGRSRFVGPNNGLFGFLNALGVVKAVHAITNPRLILDNPSSTFHGRDIFSPAAAYLSLGRPLSDFGPEVGELLELPRPVRRRGEILEGEIVAIDTFGNLVTSFLEQDIQEFQADHPQGDLLAWCHGEPVELFDTFADVPRGHLLAYVGSTHHLEIAMNCGSAEHWFNASIGSKIKLSAGVNDASGLGGE